MRFRTISTIAAALAASALVFAPAASADPEQNYLKTLEAGGFSWEGDGQPLIDLGHGACQELSSGASAADMVVEGAAETGWSETQVGYFIGAATSAFCPEHRDRAIAEAESLGRG